MNDNVKVARTFGDHAAGYLSQGKGPLAYLSDLSKQNDRVIAQIAAELPEGGVVGELKKACSPPLASWLVLLDNDWGNCVVDGVRIGQDGGWQGLEQVCPGRHAVVTQVGAGTAVLDTLVHPGRHVTWYGDDTQRSRAIAILNALLGSFGRRGGFYFKEAMKMPDFPTPEYPEPRWTWKDTLGDRFPLADTGVTNTIIDASITENGVEPKVKAWVVTGTNLPVAIPDKARLEKAFNELELVVVVDTMPMEITGYADVILPECTYLERYDEVRTAPGREPYIALRMPAAEPMGDSKPAWWMAKQLGEKLGLSAYFPYEDYTEVLDWQLQQVGSSLEELKKIGVKKFDRKSMQLYLEEGQEYTFPTPSGKIELYSEEFASYGFDPMPNYTAHPEPPEGFYRLIYGRAPMHTFSRTANNPYLTDLMDENSAWVNPKVAKLWDLKNDQKVYLKNQDGVVSDFPIKVRITERIRWDSVYMVHGFGQTQKELSRSFGKGASDTQLMTSVMMDPIMGGTGMRGNFVTFITDEPVKAVES
ncbi:MAG: molybdopterin-dependent oxidoreductase [Polyangiaceae bacterium]|nr:molybdopterin-dependent oxidoreductase [Polyangiaceae bacterium]